jgi:hypothetical protein
MADPLARRLAVFKALEVYAKEQYDQVRAEMSARMARGDRLTALTEDEEVKLGVVSKTDPKPRALITNATALRQWIEATYPDHIVEDLDVIGSDEEVKEVLLQHAPALLRQVSKADPDIVRAILAVSAKAGTAVGPGGEADVPGIEIDRAEGVVSCKPTDDALPVVREMLQRGTLDLFDVLPVGGDA